MTIRGEMGLKLGEFDACASFFESFFGVFCVFFANFFEDSAWSVVDESFGFTEAEAGNFFDSFDDSNFLCASVFEGYGEFSFFVFGSSASVTASSWASNDSCSSSWLDAVFVLEDGFEFVYFENGQFDQFFCKFLYVSHVIGSFRMMRRGLLRVQVLHQYTRRVILRRVVTREKLARGVRLTSLCLATK